MFVDLGFELVLEFLQKHLECINILGLQVPYSGMYSHTYTNEGRPVTTLSGTR